MSNGSKQEKKGKKGSADVPERECTHEYCHRDMIPSDKPIGLPWASGRLRHYPGQGPTTVEEYMLEKIQKLIQNLKQKNTVIPDVCPPIIENVLVEKPSARRAIKDEVNYFCNFVLEVGGEDVKEYLSKSKEEEEESEEEKQEDKVEKEEEEEETKDEEASEEPPEEVGDEEVAAETPADESAAGDAPPEEE